MPDEQKAYLPDIQGVTKWISKVLSNFSTTFLSTTNVGDMLRESQWTHFTPLGFIRTNHEDC